MTTYEASPSPHKQLIIDDSGYHGTDMFRLGDRGTELEQTVYDFIVSTFV